MASKKMAMRWIYIIGCALVIIGYLCPIFKVSLGFLGNISTNGFALVKQFNNAGDTLALIATVMVFAAAICGIILDYCTGKLIGDVVALAVSVLGGIILFANTSDLGVKIAGKFINIGFYLIVIGWIVALIGIILASLKKEYK
jgi:hypothetical protein